MSGRAGRPDFHDLGKVVILAEPGGSYVRGSRLTEDEVAMGLLKGDMGEVAPQYNLEQSSELYVANAVICKGNEDSIYKTEGFLVGESEPVEDLLLDKNLISREKGVIHLTPLARGMAEHFIGVERLSRIIRLVNEMKDPLDILADLECASDEEAAREKIRTDSKRGEKEKKKKRRGRKKK